MNIVGKLLEESGMSQKELSITMGVAQPSISAWVNQKADPKGANAKKLAEIFGVDRDSIVYDLQPPVWHPDYPASVALRTEYDPNPPKRTPALTDDDLIRIANIVNANPDAPRTVEARTVSFGMDNLPKETRELILGMIRGMFAGKPEAQYFADKEGNANET